MIIAAYAGTGKTTFATLHPETVTDFVCMPYKYVLDDGDNKGEACKADPDYILRDDWPLNYVSAIKRAMDGGKTLLIPSDLFVLELLKDEKIPYMLCYPQKDAKEVYRKRFLDRGNTPEFMKIFIDRWDGFIEAFERDTYGLRIVLKPDQFLSGVIDAYLQG